MEEETKAVTEEPKAEIKDLEITVEHPDWPEEDKKAIAESLKQSFVTKAPKPGETFKMRDGVEYIVLPTGSYQRLTPKKGKKDGKRR